MSDIRTRFIKVIERTGNPVAPLILQDAYAATEALGKLMANEANSAAVVTHAERLLKDYPDDGLPESEYSHDPSFIMALCSMLNQAIVEYGRSLK